MKIDGVIFDMDGTIFDTEKIKQRTWESILKNLGYNMSGEEFGNRYTGHDIYYIAKDIINHYGIKDISPEYLISEKERISFGIMREEGVELMPYAEELIEYINSLGLKMGMATGSVREEVDIKLSFYDFSKYMKSVVSKNEVTNNKPDPESYLKVLDELKLDAQKTIAFEDSLAGLTAAKDAGITTFVITTEITKNHDFSRADFIFESLLEAQKFIESKYQK